ncbi:MAG: hypothetical protein A2V88_02740 [Elusimicrobia bacterium RBG_16_66_12]|nr:MAG: hypothetical protein A2V88_02740 [Elusimicrobia bacterium RBG_16_66_12]
MIPDRSRVLALDDLCRRATMIRAGAAEFENERRPSSWYGRCEKCGAAQWLQWSHFFSRARHATRWDLDNVHALCAGCHYTWAHQDIEGFRQWMSERLGRARYSALVLRAGRSGRRPDLAAVKVYLQSALKDLLDGGHDAAPGKA